MIGKDEKRESGNSMLSAQLDDDDDDDDDDISEIKESKKNKYQYQSFKIKLFPERIHSPSIA